MRGCLIDTSVWIAASFSEHDHHTLAGQFLAQTTPAWPACLCRATEQSWLHLLTTPALHRRFDCDEVTNRDARQIVSSAMQRPNIRFIEREPKDLRFLWHRLAGLPSASPKLWMDAYLAAFAIGHGLELATLDRDFDGFVKAGLKLRLLAAPN